MQISPHHIPPSPKKIKMATYATFLLLFFTLFTTTTFCLQEMDLLQMAQTQISQAMNNWFGRYGTSHSLESLGLNSADQTSVARRDCAKLYEESEARLSHMTSKTSSYTKEDALTWVSAVMTNHKTCLDGLKEKGYVGGEVLGRNLTTLLGQALGLYAKSKGKGKAKGPPQRSVSESDAGDLLASWSAATSKADYIVAQDGSGTHKTIREAVDELAARGSNRAARAVIYVKSGIYHENVEIGNNLQNVMFVGDGIDKTVVTGSRSVVDGSTTLSSATVDVSGDGFWAKDMTFENTAGPEKYQAVALKASSDLSVFYRCSFKAYQDTLYVHSNRQFYRECQIYGTVDFIFGDAAVVLQNSDIYVRKPMSHQSNFITAQGRDDPNQPTGISIQSCRVRPESGFGTLNGTIKTFLGRPWKKYSRTVILETDLDGLISPEGWGEWSGNFALSTLYYGEYMNTGNGASTKHRVNWPGFHVLSSASEASPFSVSRFLQGERWIPATGVPFSSGI